MEIYVEIKKNKEGEGKHAELIADLGYRKAVLSYDRGLCAELTDKKVGELMGEPIGSKHKIK